MWYVTAKSRVVKRKTDHIKASDVSLKTDPEIVIGGAIDSAVNILTAASKESSVKRFVLTSSSSAAYLPSPNNKDVIIDESEQSEFLMSEMWLSRALLILGYRLLQ